MPGVLSTLHSMPGVYLNELCTPMPGVYLNFALHARSFSRLWNIFFQQHWESIFFLEKKHNPPFKLNGRSLNGSFHEFYNKYFVCHFSMPGVLMILRNIQISTAVTKLSPICKLT
jgi:hypothetical protein